MPSADLKDALSALTPDRRRLLEQLLRREGRPAPRLPILPAAARPAAPALSAGQLGLWLFDQARPGDPAYNMPLVARLKGRLDPRAYEASLRTVLARHEALRTRFEQRQGRPVQVVEPARALSIPLLDLRGLPAQRREAEAARLAPALLRRPFDLARGPLLRVDLLRLVDDEHLAVSSLHHIVGDRWSVDVLLREWAELYAAAIEPRPAALPAVPLQFADYVLWQQEQLQGERLSEAVAYWRGLLAGAPPLLDLPADRPRPAVPSGAGGQVARFLPTSLADRLRSFARSRETTLFPVLLAAFDALLCRYAGRDRIVVGTPVANRDRPELEGVIGFLVNTLVLPCDLADDPTFDALLARVEATLREAAAHQELPFDRLVEELRPARDPRFHPLYQVMLALQGFPPSSGFGGLRLAPVEVHSATAQLDLTLIVSEGREGIRAAWEYSRDLFDRPRILRLAGHLENLLAAALDAPARRVSGLPLLGAAESWQLRGEWNPEVGSWQGPLLPEAWAARVRSTPFATAVEGPGEELTYAELAARADRLAHHLRRLGVGREERVGVCLERGPDLVAALLGILQAGAVYVPLEPGWPRQRLAFVLGDAGARVVVTRQRFLDGLPEPADGGPTIVCLDRDAELLAVPAPGAALPRVEPRIEPEDLAYLIYTSGSTGRPKGVGVCHGEAARHFAAWRAWCGLGESDRVLQFASPSFDSSLEQTLPTLLAGATLVPRGEETLSAGEFVRWAADRRLTVLYLPTAYWRELVAVWARGEVSGGAIRLVNPGGDVMPPAAVRLFQGSPLGAVRLVNGYGPTEAVVTSAAFAVPAGYCREELPARIPVGRPFGERPLYVLERRGALAPVGVPGELHVAGPLLARGYVGRPDLTAERFVPDPWSGRPGARLYRTGDIVCRLADGTLDFLGRVDGQVKVRGFRIELAEVEAALAEVPGVEQAVVVAREEGPGDRRLVAYVTPRREGETAPLSVEALVREARSRLPLHMMPSRIVLLDRLPLTASGKVDRRALPEPRPEPSGSSLAASPVEELLAGIWAEVLGLARVGVEDNFFTLGGDSIVSLQVISRAHEAGLQLTPAQFFRHPTIAELARVAVPLAPLAGGPVEDAGPVPATPIQRWFFAQRFAQPHHWNQAVLLEVSRPLAGGSLHRAVAVLLARHEALRFRYERSSPVWRQLAVPCAGEPPALEADLSALAEPARSAAVAAAASALGASLDLDRGPLLRAALFDRGPGCPQLLLFAVHHLAVDGVSWRILLDELERAVAGDEGSAETAPLPPPAPSFRRWARALEDRLAAGEFDAEIPYWREQAAAEEELLAARDPAGADTVASAVTLETVLEVEQVQALLRATQPHRLQVVDLLVAALVRALVRGRRRPVVRIELESHGREAAAGGVDPSSTVGWFTAKFPVRFDLSRLAGEDAPGEVLREVKEQLRRVPRRGIGYGLLAYLDPRPEVAHPLRAAPQPAVHFNYLGRLAPVDPARRFRYLHGAAGPECGPANRLPSPIEAVAMIDGERLRTSWKFSPARFAEGTVEELADAFDAALRELIALCGERRAPLLTPGDFPLANLDRDTLDRVAAAVPAIQDLYPLSPVQHGMLFHSLVSPESGVYVEQLTCELVGELDLDAFRWAWQKVADRHPVLRTAFLWQTLERPLQAVCAGVELPFEVLDWRGATEEEREGRLRELLRTDRSRGFEVSRAPLMRLFLARVGERRCRFLWTVHHLLLDGWAEPLILQEVFGLYSSRSCGAESRMPVRRPYRDYVEWLEERDASGAESYWRRALAGFSRPNRLAGGRAEEVAAGGRHAEEVRRLQPRTLAALQGMSRRFGLTLNTLVAGAWAVLLCHDTGDRDVVFGLTLSGRPADLPGAAEMIGMFINTLPLRVRLAAEAGLLDWLGRLQAQSAELLELDFSPLVDVHGWSEVPRGQPLFETILVFMNQRRDYTGITRELRERGLEIAALEGIEQTHYPLTLTAQVEDGLELQVNYRCGLFAQAAVRRILDHLELVLAAMAATPEMKVDELLRVLVVAERGRHARQVIPLSPNGMEVPMKQLPTARRKALHLAEDGLVRFETLVPGRPLPLLASPADERAPVDLPDWAGANRPLLERHLAESGGLLFRGFEMAAPEQLERLIRAVSGDLLEYKDRATPRSRVNDRIYSSTDYPPEQTIELHNENCYAASFPAKVFFLCLQPAEEGGETPIADCREVYRHLAPELVRRFAEVGVMYVRNFVDGLALSWREAFQTEDREEMERYCRDSGIELEWRQDRLRTRQVRPALGRHPRTGERIWFNQAVAFHISTVEPAVRERLIEELTEEGVPKNSCYGDGRPFEPEVLDQLRAAHRLATVDVAWQRGDVLLLDNLLVAHGRRPFGGARKVVVGMSEPLDGETVWIPTGGA